MTARFLGKQEKDPSSFEVSQGSFDAKNDDAAVVPDVVANAVSNAVSNDGNDLTAGSDFNTEAKRVVPMRLQKFLSRAGVASRRGSENLMTAGRVKVNGQVITELGSRVDPQCDEVKVDEKIISYSSAPITVMLNKPKSYITTMSDPYGRLCVASLVPTDEYPGLFPVGRLDADTTGLLLFTTDGELGNRLMHPRHHVVKSYEVLLDRGVKESELGRLRQGIELEDGPCQPAEVVQVPSQGKHTRVIISIHEGRKRQVRRMFEALGYEVLQLHRFQIGQLVLGDLAEGTWRQLSAEELALLAGGFGQ